MDIEEFVCTNSLGKVLHNQDLRKLLSIKTKGMVRNLILPKDNQALVKIINFLGKGHYYLLGNGSNVVFSSNKTIENIIVLKYMDEKFVINDDLLTVNAGFALKKLSYKLAELAYTNLEFFSGIPGTIGGAIRMNAGCYKQETKDYLISALCADQNGEIKSYSNEELKFSYRNSLVKEQNLIVLEAVFKIKKTNEDVLKTIEVWREDRVKNQPLEYPNCGSIFKNSSIPAWKMIDQVNLRGHRINDAMFSDKHANFIINVGDATGEDVRDLIQLAKERVKEELNLELSEEIILLNF
ncbi:MAG: UDP-N-acetylmuramate dehydrogenase [Erysipelotrichales bacterium]|nr:UDP-N-acetylmuramate dehydrogenase [Erysipelotrichales bacterium]